MLSAMNAISAATSSTSTSSTAGMTLPSIASPQQAAQTPFADLMTDTIHQVNELDDEAQEAVRGLMTGSGVDVHQAMIATENANMSFELALSVRNKAVQAYQSVMSMQF
jgi:flagellar hook-basal body complex protein FliE